jgi:hypothetical protein
MRSEGKSIQLVGLFLGPTMPTCFRNGRHSLVFQAKYSNNEISLYYKGICEPHQLFFQIVVIINQLLQPFCGPC